MFKTEFVKDMEHPPTLNELNADKYIPQRKDHIAMGRAVAVFVGAVSNWVQTTLFYEVVRSQLGGETPLSIDDMPTKDHS